MAEEPRREEEREVSFDHLLYSALLRPLGVKLSYTRLDIYRTCPRKYKLIYLGREIEPPSEAMLVGKAVHSALETWVAEEGEDVGDLMDIFAAACEVQRALGKISEEEEESARAMLFDYYEQLSKVERSLVVGIEHEFELIIPGARITGVIDRAEYLEEEHRTLIVTDYKSGRRSITEKQAKNNTQMAIYTMAAQGIWPADNYITELVYPRLNKSVRYQFTADDLRRHIEEIKEIALAIKLDSRFAPKGTPPICGYCGFNEQCGWGKHQNKMWQRIQSKRERKDEQRAEATTS